MALKDTPQKRKRSAPQTKKKRASTIAWQKVFISTLKNTGNIRLSAQAAGIERAQAYRARTRNPDFAIEWDNALDDATDHLEAVARQRALTISDTLLIFLLKAHRPERFRERFEVKNTGEVILKVVYEDETK